MIGSLAAAALALIGATFSLLAAIGVLRMPDTITRMHAATKVSAFGGGTTLAAAAVHFGDPATAAHCAVAIALVLLSTPVAAHLLARAARRSGSPLWDRTGSDEYPCSGHGDTSGDGQPAGRSQPPGPG